MLPPQRVLDAMAKDCRSCPECGEAPPCDTCMAGGVCLAHCTCGEDDHDDEDCEGEEDWTNEPIVTVTEEDRRIAAEVLYLKPLAPRVLQWITVGNGINDGGVAHAIARARTMAAFEERTRNVIKCLEGRDGMIIASAICGVDLYDTPIAELGEGDDFREDDVRALVLKGWK